MIRFRFLRCLMLICFTFLFCMQGQDKIRSELERAGITFSTESFFEYISAGDHNTVQLFLAGGMDPNVADSTGTPAFIMCIKKNQLSIAQTLLKHGASVNSTDREGRTGLMEAVTQQNLEAIRFLIDRDADLALTANDGASAKSIAEEKGNEPIIEMLQ